MRKDTSRSRRTFRVPGVARHAERSYKVGVHIDRGASGHGRLSAREREEISRRFPEDNRFVGVYYKHRGACRFAMSTYTRP